MPIPLRSTETPSQLLPREAYISQEWLDRERRDLFGRTWAFVGTVHDFKEAGDYRTVIAGVHTLVVIRGEDGTLRGFHNICRHRGTELLEGHGNAGSVVMCPYHRWVYRLDGGFKGAPAQAACFPGLDPARASLLQAAVGILHGLVFIHPDAEPEEPFDTWTGGLDMTGWPHDIGPQSMDEWPEEIVYEMQCNWKVFFENAIDGYHLAYLHDQTLGKVTHDKQVWETRGRHLVWWSLERDGKKHPLPKLVEDNAGAAPTAHENHELDYGGIYMIFPLTILALHPWGFSISVMEPTNPGQTLLRIRNWSPKGQTRSHIRPKNIPGFDKASGHITSARWTKHPLESGDFQTEDMWVCEKMQRALQSPRHEVAHLARGAGGEASLTFFQACIMEYLDRQRMAAE